MNGLSKRERALIFAALAVAALVVLLGATSPAADGTRALASAREDQKKVDRDLATVRADITELKGQIGGRLVSGSRGQLVREMVLAAQRAAKASGLKLTDVQPDEADDVSGIQRVPIQVSVSTRFPGAARFLYELERAGSNYQLEQVRIVATDPRSDQLDLELRLVAYVAGDKEKRDAAKG